MSDKTLEKCPWCKRPYVDRDDCYQCGSTPKLQSYLCRDNVRIAAADELAEAVKAWRTWDGEANSAADYRAKLNDLQYAIDAALAAYEAGKGGG